MDIRKLSLIFVGFFLCITIALYSLRNKSDSPSSYSQEGTLSPSLKLSVEDPPGPELSNLDVEKSIRKENATEETETKLDYFSSWREAIRNSRRGNDLLLTALFSANDEEREVVLHEAYSKNPDSVLLNYQILQFCLTVPASTLCSLPIVETLLRHDGDNLHTLIVVSVFQYGLGDADAAFVSLSNIQNSIKAEDYKSRYLAALDESSRFHGYPRNFDTLVSSFGIEAAIAVPHLVLMMSMCDEQVERGISQRRTMCSAYGKTLAEKGSSLFDRQIGLSIQLHYSGLSEAEIDNFRDPRKEKLNAEISTLNDLSSHFGENEFADKLISDKQWQTYLTIYRSEGEVAAMIYLVQVMDEK